MSRQDDCIFCKIAGGEIPSHKVYEDEDIIAFHDIAPVAPIHVLVIPKKHIASLATATAADVPLLGKMTALVGKLAADVGATDGFRLIVNTGRIGGQEVPHLHYHIISDTEPLGRMLTRQSE
ncbi:MAG: histidine triad nucleotide-binding protein [Burkholderiales bacterium]|jgi:histidine triad (HIT) family protein|nr:histidine triad nucleotide-binding protein [Burkholderiales bacterium]